MAKSEGVTSVKPLKKGVKAAKNKVENVVKKSAKPVKEALPSGSEDDSDEESAANDTSASSESSEEESEEESKVKPTKSKVKGSAAKPVASKGVNAKAKKDAEGSESDSESESAEDSDESDENEMEVDSKPAAKAKVNGNAKTNGDTKAKAEEEDDDDDDDEEDDDDSGSDSGSDSDEEDEDEKEDEAPPKKRKAEEHIAPQAKAPRQAADDGPEPSKNLFVGNLPWSVDEAALAAEFETFGELSGVRIATDRNTGRPRGFGYVEFVNIEDAQKAYEGMYETELQGRRLNLDYARPQNDNKAGFAAHQDRAKRFGDQTGEPSATLFVGNISFDAGENEIYEAFAEHAEVKAVRLPTDQESGSPKGYGYVEFNTVMDATTAFNALNGFAISGRPLRLDYAQPRADRDGGRGGRGDRGGFGGGRGGRGGFGDRGGRGGFGGRGRGGFGDRGGRGGGFGGRGGGRGGSTNRGGFGDFQGRKITF